MANVQKEVSKLMDYINTEQTFIDYTVILTIRIAWFLKIKQITITTKNTYSKTDRLITKIFPCSGGALRSLGRPKIKIKHEYSKYYKKFKPMDKEKE